MQHHFSEALASAASASISGLFTGGCSTSRQLRFTTTKKRKAKVAQFKTLVGLCIQLDAFSFFLPTDVVSDEDQCSTCRDIIRALFSKAGLEIWCYDFKSILRSMEEAVGPLDDLSWRGVLDCKLATWIMDSDRSDYSIDSIATSFLPNTLTPDDVYAGEEAMEQAAFEWAFRDLRLCISLGTVLAEKMLQEERDCFWELELPVSVILARMERIGIAAQPDSLSQCEAGISRRLTFLEREMRFLAGDESLNVRSTKQMGAVLYKRVPPSPGTVMVTAGGRLSTSEAALQKLARLDILPVLLLEYRSLDRVKSHYVEAIVSKTSANGRIHCDWNQTAVATGRLSSSSPNLQNLPRNPLEFSYGDDGHPQVVDIRQAFSAPAGRLLVAADYCQLEMRLLAHLSADDDLIRIFQRDSDIFVTMASMWLSKEAEDVLAPERTAAKQLCYGIVYGKGYAAVADDLSISIADAKEKHHQFLAAFPGIASFSKSVVQQCLRDGFIRTILGRRRNLPLIRSRDSAKAAYARRQAVNSIVQGSAGDLVKTAMLRVDAALRGSSLDCNIVLQVHDELVVECSVSDAVDVSEVLVESMSAAMSLSVPLPVAVKVGHSLGSLVDLTPPAR